MKPNWKDAPEWAQYLAMDQKESEWWWYEEEPNKYQNDMCWTENRGSKTRKAEILRPIYWDESLEKRP